jgi:hypothetical protein
MMASAPLGQDRLIGYPRGRIGFTTIADPRPFHLTESAVMAAMIDASHVSALPWLDGPVDIKAKRERGAG